MQYIATPILILLSILAILGILATALFLVTMYTAGKLSKNLQGPREENMDQMYEALYQLALLPNNKTNPKELNDLTIAFGNLYRSFLPNGQSLELREYLTLQIKLFLGDLRAQIPNSENARKHFNQLEISLLELENL